MYKDIFPFYVKIKGYFQLSLVRAEITTILDMVLDIMKGSYNWRESY